MTFQVMLSQASGYTTQTWTAGLGGHPKDFTWVDIDGDGLTDIVKVNTYGGTVRLHAALSTGSGFQNTSPYHNFVLPNKSNWPQSETHNYRFADMNGDGLIDLVYFRELRSNHVLYSISVRVYLNNGNGFAASTHWGPSTTVSASKYDLVDLTGDGLPDLIVGRSRFAADPPFGP